MIAKVVGLDRSVISKNVQNTKISDMHNLLSQGHDMDYIAPYWSSGTASDTPGRCHSHRGPYRQPTSFGQVVGKLEEGGIHFQSTTDGIDTTTPAGRFFFHVMASLAQMEHELLA